MTLNKVGHPEITNYNDLYNSSSRPINISCNISVTSEYSQEMIKTLFGNIKTLTFDLTASCACGKLRGNFYIGSTCPHCKMEVSSIFCKDLEYKGWIIIPAFLPKIIHPQVFNMMKKYLYLPKEFKKYEKRKNLTMMDYLLDPTLPLQAIYPNLSSGLTYFNYNFDYVLKTLLDTPENRKQTELIEFLDKYYDHILVDKLPVANEYLHLITQQHENSSKYQVDSSSQNIFKVYSALCSLTHEQELGRLLSTRAIDRRMYKVQQLFQNYPDSLIDSKIIGKPGLIRRSCISGRMHYTARAVIIPITDSHYGDEVYFPWEIMVVAFKSLILNHLTKRHKYSLLSALSIYEASIKNKNNLFIRSILETILFECPYKGWPVIMNRNPSVRHGASQLMFVTKILDGNCIAISNLNTASSNADFDKYGCLELLEGQILPLVY